MWLVPRQEQYHYKQFCLSGRKKDDSVHLFFARHHRFFDGLRSCIQRGSTSAIRRIHAETFFRNFIKSNRIQIVFTIFRLIWNQTDVRLVPNQLENGKYNLMSCRFNMISKIFFCVYFVGRNVKLILFYLSRMNGKKKVLIGEKIIVWKNILLLQIFVCRALDL